MRSSYQGVPASGSADALEQGPGDAIADNAVVRGDSAGLQGSVVSLTDSGELAGAKRPRRPLTNVVTDRDESSGSGTGDSGAFFENLGATTEPVTVTLPAAPTFGDEFTFAVLRGNGFTVNASGSQIIRTGADASTAGGSVASTTIGSRLDLLYASTNVWVGISSGTWIYA